MKQCNSFEEEIISLIFLKQEGEYWDFKKAWHEKKDDLLHDIICMSNNLCNRDAYIIIGIDEENNYQSIDVTEDINRKNTQKLVDFLKDKKFAGGIRPIVFVEQIIYDNKMIDVIVIKNSYNTPFYLTERYERLQSNNIYSRIMDTNTPKDKSADINIAEYLWKKRFHLTDTPLERMRYFIQTPQDWEDSPIDTEMCKYNKKSPEFIIREESDDTRDGYEYYLFGQMDSRPHWYLVTLLYYQTALVQFQGIGLDGARCFVIAPSRSLLKIKDDFSKDIYYAYYEEDSLRYDLQCFYHINGGAEYEFAYHRYVEGILIFLSEKERYEFENYVLSQQETYYDLLNHIDEKSMPHFGEIKGYNMDVFKKQYKDALVLKELLNKFRQNTT